ncbi:MAG: hypothetical protein A2X45_17785 [Lentisphaerae bacterium GWF2_50_93]|nr:MAG: hypothetical protein A2X45_17785 [Lentisphaerae bacterium GWF2_50_93]
MCLILTLAICTLLNSCVCVDSLNTVKRCDSADSCACSSGSIRSELYFGLQKPDGSSVAEAEWQGFLDKSITSRFPDGFTVFDAYGQYKEQNGKITREKTKVLVVVHKDGRDDDLKKICEEYEKAFSQELVFRTSSRVSSSLDD